MYWCRDTAIVCSRGGRLLIGFVVLGRTDERSMHPSIIIIMIIIMIIVKIIIIIIIVKTIID